MSHLNNKHKNSIKVIIKRIEGSFMRKRKHKKTSNNPNKVVHITPAEPTEIHPNQDALKLSPAWQHTFESIQSRLNKYEEAVSLFRRSALKNAAWNEKDFEKALENMKYYLDTVEEYKKLMKEAQEVCLLVQGDIK